MQAPAEICKGTGEKANKRPQKEKKYSCSRKNSVTRNAFFAKLQRRKADDLESTDNASVINHKTESLLSPPDIKETLVSVTTGIRAA